jgi:hypothetical protein
MANFSIPIEPVANLGGAVSFPILHLIEEAGQTFNAWTPVSISSTDGGVQVWNGTTTVSGAGALAGIAIENASNLGTTGAGAPQGFTPVLGPGSVIGSYKANNNQPLAVVTPPMVPINDGRISFAVLSPGTEFVAKAGVTSGPAAVATTNQMVGTIVGITIDSNGYWFADTTKNTTGGGGVAQVTQLDPRDPVGTVGGRLWITFLATAVNILA